jgi:hypothetical protein
MATRITQDMERHGRFHSPNISTMIQFIYIRQSIVIRYQKNVERPLLHLISDKSRILVRGLMANLSCEILRWGMQQFGVMPPVVKNLLGPILSSTVASATTLSRLYLQWLWVGFEIDCMVWQSWTGTNLVRHDREPTSNHYRSMSTPSLCVTPHPTDTNSFHNHMGGEWIPIDYQLSSNCFQHMQQFTCVSDPKSGVKIPSVSKVGRNAEEDDTIQYLSVLINWISLNSVNRTGRGSDIRRW